MKRDVEEARSWLERKQAKLAREAARLRAERLLREARQRAPREDDPVRDLGSSPGAQRRSTEGEWAGFPAHKREMRRMRRAEARARARRKLERRRSRWFKLLMRGELADPEGVAEVVLWAMGL